MQTMLCLLLTTITAASSGDAYVTGDRVYERPVQPNADAWQRDPEPLIHNFCNMYQPCVVEFPGREYPYRMWFFGWATGMGNPGVSGCDAIYLARSKDLRAWQIYAGGSQWDTTMTPAAWAPVLTASDKPYDAWHNGDPSVVYKEGRYYMAYSATSKPHYKRTEEHLDGMLCCIMGATSYDGIRWTKTAQPLLLETKAAQKAVTDAEHPCDFHRPCLHWDEGRWRLWFDYWRAPYGVCLGYAENTGEFGAPGGFKPVHDLDKPLIHSWPNPEIVRIDGRYHAFADPSGYGPKRNDRHEGWTSRALCEAVSDDGLHWRVLGFIPPDSDTAACHVPQALVTRVGGVPYLYLFYATQRGWNGELYDYQYDRIRAMRRPIEPPDPADPDGDGYTNAQEREFIELFSIDEVQVGAWYREAIMDPEIPSRLIDCLPTTTIGVVVRGEGSTFPEEGEHEFATYAYECAEPCAVNPFGCKRNTITFVAQASEPDWVFDSWNHRGIASHNPVIAVPMDSAAKDIIANFVHCPGLGALDLEADFAHFLQVVGESGPADSFDANGLEYELADGGDLSPVFTGNGMPDIAELLLIQAVLEDITLDFARYSGVVSQFAWDVWRENLAVAEAQCPAGDAAVRRVIAGYMMLGDLASIRFVEGAVENAFPGVDIEPAAYDKTERERFKADGDAENDGVTNREEWELAGGDMAVFLKRALTYAPAH